MADILTSNLYPPIVDTFMPAFAGNTCKVYFELPNFNTINDINTNLAQVSIRSQKNNENVLVNLGGIRYYTIQLDNTNNKYYIEILSSHLEEGFHPGLYYKVQIRFTSSNLSLNGNNYYVNTSDNPNIGWLNANLESFSEWSSVCLIKQITEPTITTTSFIEINGEKRSSSRLLRFKANVNFNTSEGECLTEYRLILKDNDDNTIFADSGIQYPSYDFPNKISYNFKKKLESNKTYKLEIYITSNDGYTKLDDTLTPIVASYSTSQNLVPTITAIPDRDLGRIKIELAMPDPAPAGSYVILTRSSNRSNFSEWEEIALINFHNKNSDVFFDYSIESGIWYDYTAQLYYNDMAYSVEGTLNDKVICLYEDIFLNSQSKQLRLRFDSHVTSYKRAVLENKVETLGSPYPFVRRNGNTNYKQFSITGLISFHMDNDNIVGSISTSHNIEHHVTTNTIEGIFITEDELYGGTSNVERYSNYNSSNGINPYNDYVKEREFREKVISFLNSGKVFLFRTLTEGLALVRLMDINFTPNQSLNNYIYTFTATAIEIAECNAENYYKYKVFPHLYSTTQLGG